MTDEGMIKRLRLYGSRFYHESGFFFVADRIEQLVATNEQLEKERDDAENKLAKAVEERDEALNQLDSARHSVGVLEKRLTDKMAKLAKAVEALGEISSYDKGPSAGLAFTARILLAELEKTE